MRKLWVVPRNDLEAQEIIRLLDEHHQCVLISFQPWGATWAKLEQPIRDYLSSASSIIGVELAGSNSYGARNIDHHRYQEEDRSHPESSLEQVAAILRVGLSREQKLIAVNDRSYIAGMRREFPGIADWELRQIRQRDRRAQGVTEADERSAMADLANAHIRNGRCVLQLAVRPNSAHFDFLFLNFGVTGVLAQSPGQWQYSGPRVANFLTGTWDENHWSGGSQQAGYFCLERPGPASQAKMVQTFWQP